MGQKQRAFYMHMGVHKPRHCCHAFTINIAGCLKAGFHTHNHAVRNGDIAANKLGAKHIQVGKIAQQHIAIPPAHGRIYSMLQLRFAKLWRCGSHLLL